MPRILSPSLACLLFLSSTLHGVAQSQQTLQASLPDSPDSTRAPVLAESAGGWSSSNGPALIQQTTPPASPADDQMHQTKRILGIIPNFRAVSANQKLPPQSAKEKFITATEDSFDYSAWLIPAALAGYSMATDATPEFHQGAAGFGRYLWHSFADQSIENYSVEFIVPALTREDIRYYTLGKGGFFKRSGYALSRAVVTRTDAGGESFNFSEVVGAGAAAGLSDLYYPSPERTFSKTAEKWSLNVGIDAATFVFKEFWPDINHALFHSKY